MKISLFKKTNSLALFIVFSAILFGHPSMASAADRIRLIAVDSDSSSSLWVRVFLEYFIPEVDKRLAVTGDYEVDWNPAFGGTIAKPKGVLESLQRDLADIGIVTTPYHVDKLPFYALPYATPFVSNDIGLIARTMSDLADKYPAVKDEWEKYKLHYLTTAGSIDTYNIVLREPFEKLEDLQGKKIGGVGLNLLYLEGSGAVAVSSTLTEWYNNIATGLMGGTIIWPEAVAAYKLYEVAPYMLDIRFGGAPSKVIAINSRTWARLPDEVRLIIEEVSQDYRDELAREATRISEHARNEFIEEGGQIVPVSEELRLYWAEHLPNLAAEWVRDMDEHGLPGQAILDDYMQVMRDNNQPIVRQWDQ